MLCGETAWVVSDHMASGPGGKKKIMKFLKTDILSLQCKLKLKSKMAWNSGELSVQAGQQVELIDRREEQVT